SAYLDSHWCFAELAIARARGSTLLPVVLEANARHPLLRALEHVDATGDLETALVRLRKRLRDLVSPGGRSWTEDRPISRGLEPFDAQDAAVFFGRSRERGHKRGTTWRTLTGRRR